MQCRRVVVVADFTIGTVIPSVSDRLWMAAPDEVIGGDLISWDHKVPLAPLAMAKQRGSVLRNMLSPQDRR